jgi:hypothetical protein
MRGLHHRARDLASALESFPSAEHRDDSLPIDERRHAQPSHSPERREPKAPPSIETNPDGAIDFDSNPENASLLPAESPGKLGLALMHYGMLEYFSSSSVSHTCRSSS